MKIYTIKRQELVFYVAVWWLAFVLLSANHINSFQILNIFGFLTLILLPGGLTLVTLRLRDLPLWPYLAMAAGLSILELITTALIGNTILPHVGITRPLDSLVLLEEFSILILILVGITYRRMGTRHIKFAFVFFESIQERIFAFFPSVFVLMAVIGALRLNNGASNIVTLVMLIAMTVYIALIAYKAPRVGPNVIPTAFFFMSLALLLMNSLRGWGIIGHDIQAEYRMFEIAKTNGIWSIAAYRDAYNACMSITVLPTIFSNLLSIADPYVYKVLFQILFAVVPSILYLNVRRYVSPIIAFISTMYFIAFPTFFTDMSFLNRQEIAFIFLALMIYIIFDKGISIAMRRMLFLILGIGMVLSHYSTTYTVIAVLVILICAQPIIRWIIPSVRKMGWFTRSAIPSLSTKDFVYKPLITLWMVLILIGASFFWSSIITNTASGSISKVITATIAAIKNNTKEDAKSSDVSTSLLSWRPVDMQAIFQSYEHKKIAPIIASSTSGTLYTPASYASYPIAVSGESTVPLTAVGTLLSSHGIDITSINHIFRQASAKLLQILIIIGIVFTIFSGRYMNDALDTEFLLLAGGSLVMLIAIVILPVLSVQYGLLRAFQQALMFLGIFLVIGNLALFSKFSRRISLGIATVFVIVFFISMTGALTQLLGGGDPQLNLNNSGNYYDTYYVHTSETAGISWLAQDTQNIHTAVQGDFFRAQAITSQTHLDFYNDIFPGIIRHDAYVFIGPATVHKQQTTIDYSGTLITYTYPVLFLENNKDLIYSNDDVRIYR